MMKPVIFVHGGAGDDYQDLLDAFLEGCGKAARAGWETLQTGGSALDAVERAVRVMEDAPVFDAGGGSFPNQDGDIELDAMVMDGSNLGYGAVAAIRHVRNPVSVARLVMERSGHSLLVGAGADRFAQTQGVPKHFFEQNNPWFAPGPAQRPQETVGALALDTHGNLAVAVSTGGTRDKLPGRVGDSPLIGCGGYADNALGAAAATGEGEALMKVLFSKTACDGLAQGLSAPEAAQAALRILEEKVPGAKGGLILLSPRGEPAAVFNTELMARALIQGDGELQLFP